MNKTENRPIFWHDEVFTDAIKETAEALKKAEDAILLSIDERQIDLNGKDITCAVLLRMKAYIETQNKIKAILGRRYISPAADFFTETVTHFLKLSLKILLKDQLRVCSEVKLGKERNSLRPDVSVWKGEELVAVIECKTQNGWNRDDWLVDIEKREKVIKESHKNAEFFLVVLSSANWGGFPENDTRVGVNFNVFLKNGESLLRFTSDNTDAIQHPLEGVINKIVSLHNISL